MGAVREHGAPRVDDPVRLGGVGALGVDETAFQGASTSFVTGVVDLTRGGGRARLLDVVADRSASALFNWVHHPDPAWRAELSTAALDSYRGYATALRTALPHAVRVLDAFHVTRLGFTAVDAASSASERAYPEVCVAIATPSVADADRILTSGGASGEAIARDSRTIFPRPSYVIVCKC